MTSDVWTVRSLAGAVLAVTVSVGLHLVGAWMFTNNEISELDGGGEPETARLGTSFADMVAGSAGVNSAAADLLDPVQDQEIESPLEFEDEQAPEVTDQTATQPSQMEVSEAVPEFASQTVGARTESTNSREPSQPIQNVDVTGLQNPKTATQDAVPETSDTVSTSETVMASQSSVVEQSLENDQLLAVAPSIAETTEIIGDIAMPEPSENTTEVRQSDASNSVSAEPEPVSPARSVPSEVIATPAQPTQPEVPNIAVVAEPVEFQLAGPDTPRPVPRPTRRSQPNPSPQATGNASQDQTRGQSSGSASGTATSQSESSNRSQNAGNSAVANYPGLVMRQIQRTRRPRARAKRPAVVVFAIGRSGALSMVRIARTSGNANFDAAVVAFIRSAAPFPSPPRGAQTSFDLVVQPR